MTVDRQLARKLRASGASVESWSCKREKLIREAVEAGGSYREVAVLAGVSHQTVANIVNRQTDK